MRKTPDPCSGDILDVVCVLQSVVCGLSFPGFITSRNEAESQMALSFLVRSLK